MDTPTGYRRAFAVHLVEAVDASGVPAQLGGFTTLREAESLTARLAAEVERLHQWGAGGRAVRK